MVASNWLPRSAPTLRADATSPPWKPTVVADLWTPAFRYIVVDERFADLVQLSVSAWPVVDGIGRLRFSEGAAIHAHADAEALRLYLRKVRRPRHQTSRELRAGDTFGAAVVPSSLEHFMQEVDRVDELWIAQMKQPPDKRGPWSSLGRAHKALLDPRTWEWLRPPVYDLTTAARDAAKLAYYGALTEGLPDESTER